MNSTTVPDPQNVNLTQFSQPTEIRDSSGCVLGFFTPASDPSLGDYFTKEELDEAAAEPGGRTLEEIWKSLGAK
jgi:hypothetical protein